MPFFKIHSFYYFIKNPQTTIALTFFTYIISAVGGVINEQQIETAVLSMYLSALAQADLVIVKCLPDESENGWIRGQILELP